MQDHVVEHGAINDHADPKSTDEEEEGEKKENESEDEIIDDNKPVVYYKVTDLCDLCLKKIMTMINHSAVETILQRIINIPAKDKITVCKNLRLTHSLNVALGIKPPQEYWHKRAIREFPAPHASKAPPGARANVKRCNIKHPILQTEDTKNGSNNEENVLNLPIINDMRSFKDTTWLSTYLEAKVTEYFSKDLKNKDTSYTFLKLCGPHIQNLNLTNFYIKPSEKGESDELSQYVTLPDLISSFPNLKRVSMRVVGPSDNEKILLNKTLMETIGGALSETKITHFCLYESSVTDEPLGGILDEFIGIKTLQFLDLRHNLITSAISDRLVPIISFITSLNLQHNSIDSEGTKLLSEAIRNSGSLTSILLDINPIRTEGAIDLLRGASGSKCLHFLSLAGCRIESKEQFWEALLLASNENSPLRFLSLSSNIFSNIPDYILKSGTGRLRVLISNIDGTVRWFHPGRSGDFLPHPLNLLSKHLVNPPIDISAQPTPVPTELNPNSPLHGVFIEQTKLKLEEELRGSCLFEKKLSTFFPLSNPIKSDFLY